MESLGNINWFAIAELAAALFLLAQGILVFIQNPRAPLNRSFFFFQLAVFVWMAGMGSAYLTRNAQTAAILTKIGFLGVTFIPITTYAFSTYFAKKAAQKLVVIIGGIVTTAAALFLNSPHFTEGVIRYPWGYYIDLGPWSFAVPGLFALFMLLFARNLWTRYRDTPTGKRWHLFAFATGVLSYLGAVDFLPAYHVALPIPPPGFIFVGIFSTLMGYFMLRYNLMDVKMVLGKTFGYLVFTGALTVLYVSLFLAVTPRALSPNEVFWSLVFFIFSVYLFGYARILGKRFAEEVLLRDQVNFMHRIERFNATIQTLQSPDSLMQKLFEFGAESLRTESTHIIFFNQKEQKWSRWSFTGGNISGPEEIPLVTSGYNRGSRPPERVTPFLISSPTLAEEADPLFEAVQAVASAIGGEVAAPLSGRTYAVGFLIIGHKKSGRAYARSERVAIGNLAGAFSTAWENAKLYESIERENKLKLDFISITSHQLRTPLTRLRWATESFSADASRVSVSDLSIVNEIRKTTDTMIGIVNQLLEVAETEKETGSTDTRETFSLTNLVPRVMNLKEPGFTRAGVSRQTEMPEGDLVVAASQKNIHIILDVLLENAIQYTKPGGTVTLSVKLEGDFVLVSIADTGIGIPAGEQEKIFEKFFRAKNAAELHPNGTGLGLYHAKLLAERHGGRMWFTSKEGAGTTFSFTVPFFRGKK